MDFKSFDMNSMQKYFSPKATEDLNVFLEKLPQNAGKTILIAAAIAWGMAATTGLFKKCEAGSLFEGEQSVSEQGGII